MRYTICKKILSRKSCCDLHIYFRKIVLWGKSAWVQMCTVLTCLISNMHWSDQPECKYALFWPTWGSTRFGFVTIYTYFFTNLFWFMHSYMENFAVQIFKHFPCLCQGADIYLEVGLYPVVALFLLLIYKWQFWNLFLSTQYDKNIYLDTTFNLLWCQGAELRLEVVLDNVVGVHLTVLKLVPINPAR